MASRSVFTCQHCDYQSAKWLGRCPECGAWAAMAERAVGDGGASAASLDRAARPVPYTDVPAADARRTSSGIAELDRVLGGGLVPGAVVLVGGEPGVGKSTLLLQAAGSVSASGGTVLYVTGEESASQLRLRGDRLDVGSDRLFVLAETDVEHAVESARALGPSLMVVDSVQAMRCPACPSVPGSVSQVREVAVRLVALAKSEAIPVLVVGHVTKDGALAGPRALEHVVDTVVSFEGERHHSHRILRAVKNRFGPTDEVAVFSMSEAGLRGVTSPSEFFLAERPVGAPGSAVLAAMEGTRPLLVEIQALVGQPVQGSPRRACLGVDGARVAMILAVVHRRAGVGLADRDVFVNVTGGMSVAEPAADLAVAAAVTSSYRGRPLPEGWALMGEIGLTGEIRRVSRMDTRLRETARMGFRTALVPAGATPPRAVPPLRVLPVAHVAEALDRLIPGAGSG